MYKSQVVYTDPVEGNCITGSTTLKSSAGNVYAVVLAAGSAADATMTLYDNTAGAGERELVLAAVQKTSEAFTPFRPIKCRTGIYVVLTGAGATVTVLYD